MSPCTTQHLLSSATHRHSFSLKRIPTICTFFQTCPPSRICCNIPKLAISMFLCRIACSVGCCLSAFGVDVFWCFRAAVIAGSREGPSMAGAAGTHTHTGGGRSRHLHVRHHPICAVLLRARVGLQPGCARRRAPPGGDLCACTACVQIHPVLCQDYTWTVFTLASLRERNSQGLVSDLFYDICKSRVSRAKSC